MARKYDLSKKSDMRRFSRDLEKEVMNIAKDSISKTGIDIECPHCGKSVTVTAGENICNHCGNQINVDFDL